MKAKYLSLISALCLMGIEAFFSPGPFAQRYPDHPIQLVIPNPAGSIADVTARLLASELEKTLGQKVIPNNKPGATSALGADVVVRSKKDGYTVLYANASALTIAPNINPEAVHYDTFKDLEPLGFHYLFPTSINVRSDSPWKTFAELIDNARKNPQTIRVATQGVGGTPHFMLEMIQAQTGGEFTHVPFKGGEAVVTAVLGGHVEVSCDAFSKVKPHVDTGKIRVLLINYKIPSIPEIPTITELGYKQSLLNSWFALYAPAGIPEEARNTLIPAIEKAVKNTKPKIEQMWGVCEYKSPSELRRMTEEEYKQIYQIAVRIGLRKP